jgi:NDP-sugar pyrophosphorylase family protein
MQAIIMAAGKGVRMQPLTTDTPKPLLKIGNETILERSINQLPDEIDEIIIVVGYLKEQIKQFVKEKIKNKKILFVDEEKVRGTGYAVTVCKDLVRGRFLVLNGDDLYNKPDLKKMLTYDYSMLCVKVPDTEEYKRFRRIGVDDDLFLTSMNGGVDSQWVITGAYTLTEEFFNVPLVKMTSGEYGLPHTICKMVDDTGVKVKIIEAEFWIPIGYPQDIPYAEELLAQTKEHVSNQ